MKKETSKKNSKNQQSRKNIKIQQLQEAEATLKYLKRINNKRNQKLYKKQGVYQNPPTKKKNNV